MGFWQRKETIRTRGLFLFCGHNDTTLELFNFITINQDSFQKWNDDMREFINQTRKEADIEVKL